MSSSLHSAARVSVEGSVLRSVDRDVFLRKNQVWFQKILPPSIERVGLRYRLLGERVDGDLGERPRHLNQIALRVLNPGRVERRHLAPSNYYQQLRRIREKMVMRDSSLGSSRAILRSLSREIELTNYFYDIKLNATAC